MRGPTSSTAGHQRSLASALVAEAKQLGINVSQACEAGLSEKIAAARRQRWLEENGASIGAYNARVESDGLTLAKYRQF